MWWWLVIAACKVASEVKEEVKEEIVEARTAVDSLSELAQGGDTCGAYKQPGKKALWNVSSGGDTYAVPVYPPRSTKGKRVALLHLHGGGGEGSDHFLRQTDFLKQIGDDNVLVVAPDSHRGWSSGKGETPEVRDDVAFLDALAKRLRKEACVEQIWVVGFSAGAAVANRWFCEGEGADALVSAAGTLMVPEAHCKGRPHAMRLIVGTKDQRFDQGAVPGEKSVPETAAFWAKHNGCSDKTRESRATSDTTCKQWVGCQQPVELCVIDGFEHGYPHGSKGKKGCQYDATAEGYQWLQSL